MLYILKIELCKTLRKQSHDKDFSCDDYIRFLQMLESEMSTQTNQDYIVFRLRTLLNTVDKLEKKVWVRSVAIWLMLYTHRLMESTQDFF
jgi:hypothetical protein